MSENIEAMQRKEASDRLHALEAMGLHPNVAREFDEKGTVYYSERVRFGQAPVGVLYWLDNEPELKAQAERLEREDGALVYLAALCGTAIGRMLALFYVSPYEEDWDADREDLLHGCACCFVCNLDDPQLSEYGGIAFAVSGGGIVRTA